MPGRGVPKAKAHPIDPEPEPDDEDPRAAVRDAEVAAAKAKPKAKAPPVPAKKESGKGKGKGKHKKGTSSGGGTGAVVPGPAPPLPPPPLPPPAAPPPPAPYDFAPASSSGGGGAEPPPKKAKSRAVDKKYKPAIGGGDAYYDEYPNPETGNVYMNWQFKCPHHHGCERVRGVNPRNTAKHGFLEPIAFLHAWRDTPPGENGHRRTDPSPAAVEAFFVAHGGELNTLFEQFASP